jgi:menaquinone-dependent protoporphyrinogen oxidase
MKVLILYASIEGQALKVTRFLQKAVRRAGHTTKAVDVNVKRAEAPLDWADCLVIVASVHRRRHPVEFEKFLTVNRDALHGKKTLLLSLSLCAAFPQGQEEAQSYVAELSERTGFTPTADQLVAGALQFKKYKDYEAQVVRFVALNLNEYDEVHEDKEFTDWPAVEAGVLAFLER